MDRPQNDMTASASPAPLSTPVVHPIPPVCSTDPATPPRVLILGSFPSVKSRESGFFYGHPQNRFWRVMATVLNAPLPGTTEEKTALLASRGIALWDVIASCTITGSSDSSIRDVVPNDLTPILAGGTVRAVLTNGGTATRLYRRYQEPIWHLPPVALPSTSPANAAVSLDALVEAWAVLDAYLDGIS